MYHDLHGKVAVVTGGSKGLGMAMARRFGQEGMDVVVDYHSDKAGGEAAVRGIEAAGGKACALKADITTPEGAKRLLDAAVERFGRLDVWVNNAGVENQVPTHEMSLEDWNRVVGVNLNGVFLGTHCALNYFLEQGVSGNILNMSSVHERIPWPTFAHYAASKGGVAMFTKTVALEYAKRGIRVNAIGPGAINTPINAEKFDDPEKLQATVDMVPIGTIGEPEDVAAAAAWLVSDEAKYVTGVTLFVDGGMVLYPAFEDGNG